ncbi:unnamed protein product [Larinioides sclopetarius]|uniref:Uncharacterized protein n=1 Tax=Larinioides sclopetarius TaxID=280406 RepID=A0AAV2BAY1_9ARAC
MTDSREIDVEVGGSIGILNAEETVSESRRVFVAREKSAQKKIDRRCAVREWVAWKTFKNVLFFICLTFLIIQSLEFFRIYYTYPTTIATEITVAKDFRLPAITFCFRNTISYKDYCSYESHRCERPSNVEKFCEKHPYHCYEDTSNLTIPKKDSSTRRNTQYYLFEDKYNDDEILFQLYNYTSKKRTFVRDVENYGQHLKCYSENLHLYQSNSIPKIQEINYNTEMADQIFWKRLLPENIEPFYPPDTPQIFVAIHSPHVPLNPVVDLHPVMPERGYIIYVQLEKEEHLLPPPYQTNCKDNGPTKDAKEFNSPNSNLICRKLQ